jgi:hypothetical protein
MSLLRYSLTVVALLGLTLGYASSQRAFFTAQAAEYAERVAQPPIKMAALGLLLLAVVLAFIPERSEAAK